jgi:Family of unknown function (DUF6113)
VGGVRNAATRTAESVLCLLLGGVVALVGAFVHTGALFVVGIAWPLGLVLALGLEILALRLAGGVAGRTGVWQSCAAWVAVVLVLTWPRAAGDIVIPGTWYGYAFLFVGMAIAMGMAVLSQVQSVTRVQEPASAAVEGRR